ncbi:MAG: DNA polymerase III subunit delta [Clostridiales bacterium]|nr:DNA polymerase III subunit delta [Clostridiales bacterium]
MTESDFYKATQSAALSGPYLLHGEEELTKADALRRVLALLDEGMREMNYTRLIAPDARALLESCATLPLFDRFRIVVATEPDEDALSAALAPGAIPPETILLLLRRGKAKDSKTVKAFVTENRAVEFAPLTEDRAMKLIARVAVGAGVEFSPALARDLVQRVGTSGHTLQNEAEKLCAYAGQGAAVTKAMLDKCVVSSEEADVFNLLKLFLRGKQKEGLALLRLLQQQGKSAMQLAHIIVGNLRQMAQARAYLDAGNSVSQAASLLGGNAYGAQKNAEAAKATSAARIQTALARMAEVDFYQKQGKKKDADALLWGLLTGLGERE